MEEKKNEIQSRHSTVSTLGTVCAALAVLVMAGGVVMFNNYNKMKEMESVIASVLPAEYGQEWLSGGKKTPSGSDKNRIEQESGGVTIEELSGGITSASSEIMIETTPSATVPGTEQMPGGNSTIVAEETMAAAETTGQAPVPETTSAEEAERIAAMAAGARTHVVQPGETLYGICLEYYQNLSRIDDVCLLNGLESQDKIAAGQKLLLP